MDSGRSTSRLRLASLNVWALPWRLAKDTAARVEAIGLRLASIESDLVMLQEVWTDWATARLVAAGRAAGFSEVWRPARARGGSGLLLLSRQPLLGTGFQRYDLAGLPQNFHHGDYHGGKGFVLARVATPLGPVAVLTTHLHAQYTRDSDDIYRGHRTGQVVELAAALRGVHEPVLAAGDFNLREGRPEYRVLTGLSGLRDLAAEVDRRANTARRANPYRRQLGGDQRIDFIFARDGTEIAVRPLRVERIFDEELALYGQCAAYSDHDGVFAEVALEPRASAPLPAPDPEAGELAAALLSAGVARARARLRRQRTTAAAAGVVGAAAFASRRHPALTRRAALRRGLGLLAGTAFPLAAGNALLSEFFVPRELAAYGRVMAELEALRAREGPASPPTGSRTSRR